LNFGFFLAMTHKWDLIVSAHAKINLGLYVLGKRSDGYHDIWTIFQELEFHDTLYFRKHADKLLITTDHPSLPIGENNLVWQAVRLLSQHISCPENVTIHIEKNIPLGSGLGGGSSDAATTLLGMNRLFQLGLSPNELAEFGVELGSDVPFFLHGGTALATGRGEHIRPLSGFSPTWVLLVNPGIHISSGWAYKNVNLRLTNSQEIISVLPRGKDIVITGAHRTPLKNLLEEPVIKKYPVIRSIKAQLLDNGAEWAMMSGSGSTVFGIFSRKASVEKARQYMERPDWLVVVTQTRMKKTVF
jgi:4-diphosphocytidyl-2-C-methyl-D-erythritol kinase